MNAQGMSFTIEQSLELSMLARLEGPAAVKARIEEWLAAEPDPGPCPVCGATRPSEVSGKDHQ